MSHAFYNLNPQTVMDAVESCGYHLTGEYFQLNSYENRVFDVRLEEGSPLGRSLIVKFYRPQRWSLATIKEEHEFLFDLQESGFPVVAPLKVKGESAIVYQQMIMTLFPKALGRMPQELNKDQLIKIGRSLARLHNCGEQKRPQHRPLMNAENFGRSALDLLDNWVSPEVWERYRTAAETIIEFLDEHLDETSYIRIHGDCHKGNLLMTDQPGQPQVFFFVDFDDFCLGPVAQDFWMLFSDEREYREELDSLLTGYEELRHFPEDQYKLFSPLRGLRIIHYAAWIARRWEDPSFPRLFPDFETYSYWAQETEALEKIAWSL